MKKIVKSTYTKKSWFHGFFCQKMAGEKFFDFYTVWLRKFLSWEIGQRCMCMYLEMNRMFFTSLFLKVLSCWKERASYNFFFCIFIQQYFVWKIFCFKFYDNFAGIATFLSLDLILTLQQFSKLFVESLSFFHYCRTAN